MSKYARPKERGRDTSRPALGEQNGERHGLRTRIWRLQYGPCWCHGTASESASYDYVRMRRTATDFGTFEKNILIVSERVIDGTENVYRQVHASVPDPRLVISAGTCPTSDRFWNELPNGWVPVDQVIPIDLEVSQCVTGNPEALAAALLGYVCRQPPRAANEHPVAASRSLTLTSTGEPTDA